MNTILGWLNRLQNNQIAPVVVSTASKTITREQALRHVYVSNAGAAAQVTFTLPAATPGLRVTAISEVTGQQIRIKPATGETLAVPSTGAQSTVDYHIWADALAETVELVCLVKGTWDVVNFQGTWTAAA